MEDTKKEKGSTQEPKPSSVDQKKQSNSTTHVPALLISYNCIRKDTNEWEEFKVSQHTMLEITQKILNFGHLYGKIAEIFLLSHLCLNTEQYLKNILRRH